MPWVPDIMASRSRRLIVMVRRGCAVHVVFEIERGSFCGKCAQKLADKARDEISSAEEGRGWVRISEIGDAGLLVKRMGEGDWVPKESSAGRAVMAVKIPDSDEAAYESIPDLNAGKK